MKKISKYLIAFIILTMQVNCSNNKTDSKSNSKSSDNSVVVHNTDPNSRLWYNKYQKNSTKLVINKNSVDELNITDLKKGKDRLDVFLLKVVYKVDRSLSNSGILQKTETVFSNQLESVIMGTDEFTNIQIGNNPYSDIQIEEIKEDKIVNLIWSPYVEFNKIVDILNLNVRDYYWDEIQNKYKTELRREVFLESKEYQTKLNKLKRLKENLLKKTYYIDLPISYSISNYDLEKSTFNVQRSGNYYKAAMSPNVFKLDHLLLKLPSEINVTSNSYDKKVIDYTPSGYETRYKDKPMIRQTINLKVNNKQTAYDIETNKMSLRLFFVFSLGGIDENNRVYSEVDYVAIYNYSSGNIYKIYQ